MIEPSKVLDFLNHSTTEETTHTRYKRPLELYYSNDSLKDVTASLFYPSISEPNELTLTSSDEPTTLDDSSLRLDLEYVSQVCNDTNFFITPSESGFEYLLEGINLFESCLNCLPEFQVEDNSSEDLETHFNNLVDSFFLYLEHERVNFEFQTDLEDFIREDSNNLVTADFKTDEYRPLMRQLFLSLILGYNWCRKLFKHTQTAIEISKSDLNECETQTILDTSLGLREANRNYVFYNAVSQNLLNVLKSKENRANSFIAEFLERLGFFNTIANTDMAYEPISWNRIKLNFTVPETKAAVGQSMNEHEENLKLIRHEMAKRLAGRSKCEYLRREVENANSEMLQMEAKNEEVMSKLEALKKQLSELPNSYKLEPLSIGKFPESKRLPKKLFDLFSHLNNFSQSNPLREINFKILKDYNFSFQMIISPPKDILFPSLEATKFVFPLVFHFYLEDDKLKCDQVNSTKLSTSKSISELVMNKFLAFELQEDVDFGLDDFDDQLSQTFHETMENLYGIAQEFVWNLYILESYKTNNKSILSKILPDELQDSSTHSKYTYKEKNTWTLSNDAASVTVQISNQNNQFHFEFTEFEKSGSLEEVEESHLVDYLKERYKELSIKSLNEMAPSILDHFNTTNDLINIAILFESYSIIFDFISS